MLRFTIRDWLWLMVVVGLALVLMSERRQRVTETSHLQQVAEEHRKEADKWHELADSQMKAFHIEQSNMQAARVRMLDEYQRRLQEMKADERKKYLPPSFWPEVRDLPSEAPATP
jgi:DNA anti-recombination protein RmuC